VWIVTGASGFVGSHVVATCTAEARGLSRRQLPRWDVPSLKAAFTGADTVIHAASIVHKPSTPAEEYLRFNVEGTRALLAAAREAGVGRVVFLSSIKVHGETPPPIIDESTPTAPEGDYAATKLAAERLVLEAEDLAPVVLRLCPVYGRGDKGNVRTMIRATSRRRFFVPGDGSTKKSIVHVSTVAEVVRAAARSRVSGVFVVADRTTPSIRQLADEIARALGTRRPLAVPRALLRGTAGLAARGARALGVTTSISSSLIDKAMTTTICNPSRAQRELGVDCHVDLAWALGDEISWLREIGDI
jgi:nucleoside-diphosphate-sugar epimerase